MESALDRKKRTGPGRPTVWTEDRVQKLEALISEGMSIVGACRAVGIGESTFFQRQARDAVFRERIGRAESASEERLLEMAKAGARKDGRVAIMLLERRFPGQWSQRDKVDHNHVHVSAPAEVLKALVRDRRERDQSLLNAPIIEAAVVSDT